MAAVAIVIGLVGLYYTHDQSKINAIQAQAAVTSANEAIRGNNEAIRQTQEMEGSPAG